MGSNMMNNLERICELNVALYSPTEYEEALFIVAQNGDIYKQKDNQLKLEYQFGGQPSGITFDKVGKNIFVADMASQSIMAKSLQDSENDAPMQEMVKEFEGTPLLGPNSLVCSSKYNCLYFSDSGPFGESNAENKKGSLFMIDLDAQIMRPLALNCLAYPSGLALSNDEQILYLCETCNNRILRFVLTTQGIYYFSNFVQFSGRYGPRSIANSASDLLYVARFEFIQFAIDGMISVVNSQGQILENLIIPGAPEITGLCFSRNKPNILYATENTQTPCCYKMMINSEEKTEQKENLN